jgi:Polyketide cyclase / dehydrase and lipid transport
MGTWSTCATLDGRPESVLDVLTDPEACERWSPVSFEVDGVARLSAGSRARVGGSIVGRRVEFDVEILEADERRLALRAQGPIEIEARYDARPCGAATCLDAEVSVRSRGGLAGRLMAGAADGLLAAGALDAALRRIANELAPAQALAA